MDFRKFLEMVNEEDAYDKDAKSSDKPHDKEAAAERAKKAALAAKDKKKSLKDWFEAIDKNMINEADQLTIEPAKQSTQVIKQGTKTLGTVSNPALAATIKSAIGKGEMSLAGDEMKEDALDEKWAGDAKVEPTGQYAGKSVEELKSMLTKLKKSGPHKEGTPGFKKMRQVMFAIRAKKDWKGGVDEASVEESGLQAYLGKKKYGEEGMKALQQAGRDGASKEKMAQIRAKHDKLDEVQVDEKAKNPYAVGMAQAMKSTGDKPPLKKSTITKAHDIAKSIKKTDEAEIPHAGPDYGAGLGAGRSQKTLEAKKDFAGKFQKNIDKSNKDKKETEEKVKSHLKDEKKKKVDEAMNTLEAAYHEGKSHGLSKSNYACRYNEGSDEHRRYHEGFKEGIDECYGLMPNRGLVVSEIESGQDVVDDMASYGAEEGALGEMDKTAYMKQQAMKTPGDTFKAFGQTMHDKDVLETDAFAFESLDKQLNDLLNENVVSEGLSVNMSQGLDDGMGDDSVSVSATGDDAGKLLAFIKQVGLGGLGGEQQLDSPAEPAVAMSDYGAPKFSGYDDKGGMMGLLKVMSGGDDYKDEEGHDHAKEQTCNECGGMMEAGHECGEGKEMVDEVESEDQMEYQVAEDDGEGYEQGQEAAAQIDSALAAGGSAKGGATNEDGMESNPLAADAVASADAAEEEQEAMSESRTSFLNLYKKLAWLAEESTSEKDDKAEKAAKKVAKDIEYDEDHKGKDDDKAEKAGEKVKKDIEYDDKKDKKEKVDEWANDAGKDGTQQTFERDIEFMTKVISGGLNKPKSTGQQTIPVLAGDKERTGDEDFAEFRRLAGLGQ
jgi:hypothetical protein